MLAAVEQRYQRSQIQQAAFRYESQIYSGVRPIIGLNKYAKPSNGNGDGDGNGLKHVQIIRTPVKKKKLAVERLKAFKRKNDRKANAALERLQNVVDNGGNVFAELINTVEVCSLGQITEALHSTVGHYRPTV